MAKIKTSGSFEGKSNALGHGGRAAQLKAQGVPGGVIGMLARKAHAAPGEANYHGKKNGGMIDKGKAEERKEKGYESGGTVCHAAIKEMNDIHRMKCGGMVKGK